MKKNVWSMQTGLSLFALVVVGLVLLDHVRGVEPTSRPAAAAQAAEPTASQPAAETANEEKPAGESENTAESANQTVSVDAAIRKTAADFQAAFDRGDAAAIAALWTPSGEYINQSGKRFSGRSEIEAEYAHFFAEHPGAKIEIRIDTIRELGPDTAIEDGHASLVPHAPGTPASSPYTVIHSKVDGQWLMASVREPVASQQTSSPLENLDWLVGSWHAEKSGASMEVSFRWVANHAFLERTYTVEQRGRVTASGVELIGQDAGHQEIQSWDFTSDSGYAVGNWMPQADGWAIVTRGKLPNGDSTSAVNYLSRVDDKTLVWQSRERTIEDDSLPDTDEVRLTRVAGE